MNIQPFIEDVPIRNFQGGDVQSRQQHPGRSIDWAAAKGPRAPPRPQISSDMFCSLRFLPPLKKIDEIRLVKIVCIYIYILQNISTSYIQYVLNMVCCYIIIIVTILLLLLFSYYIYIHIHTLILGLSWWTITARILSTLKSFRSKASRSPSPEASRCPGTVGDQVTDIKWSCNMVITWL